MNDATQLTEFDSQKKIIAEQGKKFQKWCEYFLDPKSDTHGNATKSALKAYKTKKYFNAGAIGHQNYKKLQNMGVTFSEAEGISIKEWYKIAASKALKGSYEQTIDFMREIGILEKPSNVPSNQVNQQFNFGDLAESFAQARKERGLDTPAAVPTADSGVRSSSGNSN